MGRTLPALAVVVALAVPGVASGAPYGPLACSVDRADVASLLGVDCTVTTPPNGGFESCSACLPAVDAMPDAWTLESGAARWTDDVYRQGDAALEVECASDGPTWVASERVPVEAGKYYEARGWAVGDRASDDWWIGHGMTFYDADGNELPGGGAGLAPFATTWQEGWGATYAPAEAAFVAVKLLCYGTGAGTATGWYDDMSVAEATPAW